LPRHGKEDRRGRGKKNRFNPPWPSPPPRRKGEQGRGGRKEEQQANAADYGRGTSAVFTILIAASREDRKEGGGKREKSQIIQFFALGNGERGKGRDFVAPKRPVSSPQCRKKEGGGACAWL